MRPGFLKRSSRVSARLALACAALVSGACAPSAPEQERRSTLKSAILDGVLSGPDRAAVVKLLNGTNCTATLVAPNLIVTTLGCVAEQSVGSFSCAPDGTVAWSEGGRGTLGRLIDPSYLSVQLELDTTTSMEAQAVEIFAPVTDTICRNNLAFLLLERELDVTPAAIRMGRGVSVGESTLIAGFGSDGGRYVTELHELPGVPILAVGESEFTPDGYGSIRNTFAIGPGPCNGDHGSPAFSESTGALLGVMSISAWDGDCRSAAARNMYTQLAPYEETVTEAFAAAGYSAILEDDGSAPDGETEAPRDASAPAPGAMADEPDAAKRDDGGDDGGRAEIPDAGMAGAPSAVAPDGVETDARGMPPEAGPRDVGRERVASHDDEAIPSGAQRDGGGCRVSVPAPSHPVRNGWWWLLALLAVRTRRCRAAPRREGPDWDRSASRPARRSPPTDNTRRSTRRSVSRFRDRSRAGPWCPSA
jgi:hypothetical protein